MADHVTFRLPIESYTKSMWDHTFTSFSLDDQVFINYYSLCNLIRFLIILISIETLNVDN